jgi:hypothetical protein
MADTDSILSTETGQSGSLRLTVSLVASTCSMSNVGPSVGGGAFVSDGYCESPDGPPEPCRSEIAGSVYDCVNHG